MKSKFARDFFTGLTAIGGIAGLVAMLALFGELRNIGQEFYNFKLHMDTGGGLSATSRVTLNGVRVGTITHLVNAADPSDGVLLTIRVKADTRIPSSFEVFIEKTLVGDANLDLIVTRQTVPDVNFVNPDEVYNRKATGLFDKVQTALAEPLQRLTKTADNIDELAATYTQVGKRLDALVAPRTPAEVAAGAEPNLTSAIARADTVLAGANEWLGDDQFRGDLRTITAKTADVLDQASQTAQSWRDAADTVNRQIASTGQKVDELAGQATGTLRRLDQAANEVVQVTASVNKGEGTLGQFIHNPEVYNAVRDAAKRLERALAEFQMLVEKYKEEGIPLKL